VTRKRDIKQFRQACKEAGLTVRERYEASQALHAEKESGEFSPRFSPPSDFGLSADISPPSEFGSTTGKTDDGRGGFRTCDLSRVNKYLTSADVACFPCKSALCRSRADL
jgi:hypothetical protein